MCTHRDKESGLSKTLGVYGNQDLHNDPGEVAVWVLLTVFFLL